MLQWTKVRFINTLFRKNYTTQIAIRVSNCLMALTSALNETSLPLECFLATPHESTVGLTSKFKRNTNNNNNKRA